MVFRLRNARSGPGLPVILALLFTAMTIAIPWSHSGSQAQAAASDNSKPEHWISIRIHEGPVVTYVTEACELLHQDGLLPLQQTELRKGESVGIAYKRMLDNVPFWLNDLAGTLNQKTPSEMRRLLPGTPIVAPRMEVTVKEYKRTINQRDPNQKLLLERLITAGYKTEKLTRDPGYLNVIAKSNQLLFRFETREQLNSALSKLREYVRNVNDSSRLVMPSIRLDSSLYYENLKFTPFASLLKRWLAATHQGKVGKVHLQRYLDEFTFRFNRRKSRHVGKIFHRLVEQLVLRKALTYRDITAKHPSSN